MVGFGIYSFLMYHDAIREKRCCFEKCVWLDVLVLYSGRRLIDQCKVT